MEARELLLLGSELVSIARGETPVIFAQNGSVIPLGMATNALRSGCPAVQLLFGDIHEVHFATDLQRAEQTLKALRLPGERFMLETKAEHPYVVLVRREVDGTP